MLIHKKLIYVNNKERNSVLLLIIIHYSYTVTDHFLVYNFIISSQAALGPVALDAVRQRSPKSEGDFDYATKVLMMCVLSILVTAPLGAIIITLTGPRLLTKTSTIPPDGWRRSARPSLRDISIIDEEENSNEENITQS